VAHRLNYSEIVCEDLVGIAAIMVELGRLELAAQLLGGADVLREQLGISALDPVEERIKERALAVIEADLRAERRMGAFARGRAMNAADVAELALSSAA
jgi:hypothetical protein